MADTVRYARYAARGRGYELSTKGDSRFSALVAQLADGRTIEMHYQGDVKQRDPGGRNWRLGKGKPPLDPSVDLWAGYLDLWRQWARLNPELIEDLRAKSRGLVLTDMFASSPISQARALAQILNETEPPMTAANRPPMGDLIERASRMTLPLEFLADDNTDGRMRFSITSPIAKTALIDPFWSDGLIHEADPVKDWGVPLHDAEVVRDLNRALESSIDTALGSIQQALGVTTGDYAGLYFSDDRVIAALHNELAKYMDSEVRHGLQAIEDDREVEAGPKSAGG